MKGITVLTLIAALQLGLTGCALQQTCCTRDSYCCDVSSVPETSSSDNTATDEAPTTPEVEPPPSPAAEAPAASDEASERASERAARTATRPSRPNGRTRLVPSQNPQIP